VDAAEVGGGVGVLHLPLGVDVRPGCEEWEDEKRGEGTWHSREKHTSGAKVPIFFSGTFYGIFRLRRGQAYGSGYPESSDPGHTLRDKLPQASFSAAYCHF
jgi:hypothetical protein